jgi:hypothetical protein
MRIEQELAEQRPTLDLEAPTTTYRISVDVDMAPAEMSPEQACGLFVVALEGAYTIVRAVRINQCSALTKGGMQHRDCNGTGEDASRARGTAPSDDR